MSLPSILPNYSPLLEASWVRWADRGVLVRRDIEMVLEGFSVKSRFLNGLREKIKQHRQDDIHQLAQAQVEASSRWAERLSRLEKWQISASTLTLPSNRLLAWRDSSQWFDRAQTLSERYQSALARKVERLEKQSAVLTERMQGWSDRLVLKEVELHEIIQRQSEKATEILVSSARKRPYLDFLFSEREEEGRLALDLKSLSGEAGRTLARLGRLEVSVSKKADANPAYFEIRKNQIFNTWRPLQLRVIQLSQQLLNQGLPLEQSRQRLRGIYEIVQRMRIVQEISAPPVRRPLLHRLFNIQDD